MITKRIDGVDWDTDSPSLFIHNSLAVYLFVSPHTGRRYWQIMLGDGFPHEVAVNHFATRSAAMQYAKTYLLEAA